MTGPTAKRGASSWRGRWPGLVWAAPLAALIIVAYLGLQAFAQRGIDVVVTFESAHGARAGDTPVVYKGVRIGRVTKIEVSKDIRHVDMTLRLTPRTRDVLRDGAKFWMIGAQPSLTDLSSLSAVVSGVSIGAAPGSGAPRRRFVGLDSPPPVPPGEAGSYYLLDGDDLGAMRVGAGVYYQGLEVGRVTQVTLDPAQGFSATAFVATPYDRLVKPDSLFYGAKALEVRLTRTGLAARLGPGNSPLTGGVEFETPAEAAGEPQSLSGATFLFHPDLDDAELGPIGPEVVYHASVAGGGGLRPGAPVLLEGFVIGRVLSRRLSLDAGDDQAAAAVQVAIAPERLGLSDEIRGGAALSPSDWRRRTDAVLARLIRRGYRLQLTQTPPVVGPAGLDLVRLDAPPPANGRLARGDLPSAGAVSLGSVIARADGLLRSAQAVPLAEIGRNLRQLTGRLDTLAGSPQVADSLMHLHAALANLDQITADVRPQAGPLATKLVQAADNLDQAAAAAKRALGGGGTPADASLPDTLQQITAAARALRTLADDIDRHPEALLKGKGRP
ncbi:intermembrane transport protein PqiB [Phenylobacterium sp.]|jgi:paraquat-inducible protein B|uniref:PqiB family protein n=1 Tax=Phenylobacterium sp. TaxID=1871053 RepID=UPI002E2EDCB7|nr:MlaD family protein [Phenylobacterium sp.]HEX3364178.1 MlaD family protein [Phenylobacterium sp.]